jgi:hypothetical protein
MESSAQAGPATKAIKAAERKSLERTGMGFSRFEVQKPPRELRFSDVLKF